MHLPETAPPVSAAPPPKSDESKSRKWAFWLAAALVFVLGAVLRMQTLTELWTGVHNAWGGAFYSNVARNFLRYGYWTTEFAPVVSSGIVDPSQFEIYYHHPPMTMWLTSLSFLAFGIHEWSARLVPLVFSLGTMALVFQFARSAYGKGPALCALVVMAVLPIDAYYGTHVDPNSSVSIFFTALAVEGYRRWLDSGRRRDFAVMLIAIVLGCMTGWFTYLVIPGIVVHGWLIHQPEARREMLARLWILPAASVVVFGLFFLHREIALSGRGPEVYDSIGQRFLVRTVDFGLDRSAIMLQYLKNVWWLYTVPVVALSAAWFSTFVYDLWKGRLRAADWCILILWSYGLLYALVFPGHLISHDFFVRTYAPGVALACGAVLWRFAGAATVPIARLGAERHVRRAVVGAVLVVVSLFGVGRTLSLYASDDRTNGPLLRGFAEAVATVSNPRDPVFIPGKDRVLQYYVDRPMTIGVNSPEILEAETAGVTGRYLVIVPERSADRYPELLAHLRERYPERRDRGLHIFMSPSNESESEAGAPR